jgi:hypothetical protein
MPATQIRGNQILDATVGTVDITDKAVTDVKLRDAAALSVIGRSANSIGTPADLAASLNGQVLRVSGTSLGFGAIDLNSPNSVAGLLAVASGGTGQSSYVKGDLLVASATAVLSKLAVGTDGQLLQADSTQATGVKWVTGVSGYTDEDAQDAAAALFAAGTQVGISFVYNDSANSLSATVAASPPSGPAGGDLAGTYPNPQTVGWSGSVP